MTGRDHELSLLAYLWQNPEVFKTYASQLREFHFTYEPARLIYLVLHHSWESFETLPSLLEAQQLVKQLGSKREMPVIFIQTVVSDVETTWLEKPTGFTSSQLRSWVLGRSVTSIAHTLISTPPQRLGEELPEAIKRLERVRMNVGGGGEGGLGIFPFSDDTLRDPLDKIRDLYGGDPIPTGIRRLDQRIDGLLPGELGIIVGTTGVGKSMCAQNFAISACSNWQPEIDPVPPRVVYYAFDSTLAEMLKRIYALTTKEDITSAKQRLTWGQTIKEARDHHGIHPYSLLIKEYGPRTASVQDLAAHLNQVIECYREVDLRSGVAPEHAGKVHMVVVDYADQVKGSGTKVSELRHQLQGITEDLVALAKYFKVGVWSPTQSNRVGLSQSILTLENLAEGYSKSWAASHVFGLCQTAEQRAIGKMGLAALKSRRTEAFYYVPLVVDYRKMLINDDPDLDVQPLMTFGTQTKILKSKSENGTSKEQDETSPEFRTNLTNGIANGLTQGLASIQAYNHKNTGGPVG